MAFAGAEMGLGDVGAPSGYPDMVLFGPQPVVGLPAPGKRHLLVSGNTFSRHTYFAACLRNFTSPPTVHIISQPIRRKTAACFTLAFKLHHLAYKTFSLCPATYTWCFTKNYSHGLTDHPTGRLRRATHRPAYLRLATRLTPATRMPFAAPEMARHGVAAGYPA